MTALKELPKLYFSPYSKDVVKMLAECSSSLGVRVGLICSRSQVNSENRSVGYTGFSQASLAAFVADYDMLLCRDHLGKTEDEDLIMKTINADESAGFGIVHLHVEDPILVRRVETRTKMLFELGTGEAYPRTTPSYIDYMDHLIETLRRDVPDFESHVAYLSFPTGCLIQEAHNLNRVDPSLCEFMRSFGIPLKGHNSDYASAATLHMLRDAGLAALNVAPQLGVIVTRAYVDFARTFGHDLSNWENTVYDGGRWKVWGSEKYAIELGGQYHLNELPAHFRDRAYQFVLDRVYNLLSHYKLHFVGKGQ